MVKVIGKNNKEGMINIIANDLYRFEDIQEACIKLGFDNHKMLDELTGFPTGKDKCIGVLVDEVKEEIEAIWKQLKKLKTTSVWKK